ncbi:Transporter of the ATP-binding cassette (ABC), partial [Coemansia helicoidea]
MGGIAQSYWVRIWMSSTSDPNGSEHGIVFWLGIYSLLEMFSTALYMVAWLVELSGSIRAARKYHEDLFERVVNAVPRFFDKTPIGRVISRFSRDMRTIDESIIGLIVSLGMQVVQVASVFAIISSVMPPFVVIAASMTCAYAMLAVYYLNATRELKRLDSISMSPLLSLFSELITGVESIRAFGAQNQYTKEAMNRVNVHNRPYYLMWGANRWLCTRIEFSGCIVSFSATVLIIMGLDSIDAGLAGFVLMYAMSFSDYMLWFIRNYSECEISMNSVERVNQYLVLEQEAPAHAEPHRRPPADWPRTGTVDVQDLTI